MNTSRHVKKPTRPRRTHTRSWRGSRPRAAEARAEVERIKADAAEKIAAAENDASRRIGEAQEEGAGDDRGDPPADRHRDRGGESLAAQQVDAAQEAATEAQLAQTRAETQTAAAQAAATEAREDVDRLRGELADLRTEARTDREQARADHAAQLAEVRQSASERVDASNYCAACRRADDRGTTAAARQRWRQYLNPASPP